MLLVLSVRHDPGCITGTRPGAIDNRGLSVCSFKYAKPAPLTRSHQTPQIKKPAIGIPTTGKPTTMMREETEADGTLPIELHLQKLLQGYSVPAAVSARPFERHPLNYQIA